MADDKTTKTPEQPVTDSGPGKEYFAKDPARVPAFSRGTGFAGGAADDAAVRAAMGLSPKTLKDAKLNLPATSGIRLCSTGTL